MTPKFDRIAIEFMRRIGDNFITSFTPGTAMPVGEILDNTGEITAYINKALLKFFGDNWTGDKLAFTKMFPELVVLRDITLSASAKYIFASPNLDYYELLEFSADSKIGHIIDRAEFLAIKGGLFPLRDGSADSPIGVEISGVLNILPIASFASKSAEISFIKQPLDPTTGGFLIQDGDYDSPYYETWNSKIAEIAEALYKVDIQKEA